MAEKLSKAFFKSWERNKEHFIQLCTEFLETSSHLITATQSQDIRNPVYQLLLATVQGDLAVEQVHPVLQKLESQHYGFASLLADLFVIIDAMTLAQDLPTERETYLNIVSTCVPLITETVLKERLDGETLETLTLIDSRNQFQSRYVKVKTKLFYKQQKFNLLREEAEGYSKLVTELNQDLSDVTTHQHILDNLNSLVGCFDLDPNRVLDIILESFECRPEHCTFFIPLIRHFISDKETVCHILGHKFHFYHQTQDSITPESLYHVAALLVTNSLIDLDLLYLHLSPNDSDIVSEHKKQVQEANSYVRKLTVVSLSDAKTKDDAKPNGEKEAEKIEQMSNNQKIGLCEALINIGAWQHAHSIMSRLPTYFAVRYTSVAEAMCKLIHNTIEPLYVESCGLSSNIMKCHKKSRKSSMSVMAQVSSFHDLSTAVFPMLTALGPHLSCDRILITKVLRMAQGCRTKLSKSKGDESQRLKSVLYGFLALMESCILPSLSLIPASCFLSEEVWNFLKHFKYENRYRIYGLWQSKVYSIDTKLVCVKARCTDKAKYIMKRLAKENVKQFGRQIGKLSHSNPAILFQYILSQIQKFNNFIGPVVDALKYLTNLSYDVLVYCLISSLCDPDKAKMKLDDTNISLWLQSLANFSGTIFKKYSIELTGLIQYVMNQIKDGENSDLLILREVLQKMAGIEISEELTAHQLSAFSGGDLLKQEGGYFAQVRNTRKSSSRLKDALIKHSLAVPLCILLGQQRTAIIYHGEEMDNRHLKLVSKLYDQCQDTFVQFCTFLSNQLTAEELNNHLPTIDQLVSIYHLAPEAAFQLCRIVYHNTINHMYESHEKALKSRTTATTSDPSRAVDSTTNANTSNSSDNTLATSSSTATSSSSKDKVKELLKMYLQISKQVMDPVVVGIQSALKTDLWDSLSPSFYVTFWSLSMYDLKVPRKSYDHQIDLLMSQARTLPEKSKKQREKDDLIKKLKEEKEQQMNHVKRVAARIKHEKDSWFINKTAKNSSVISFLQQCIIPRCGFSAVDATYCAHFIYTLHINKTQNFSSLICYDRILTDITYFVTSCTENEAHRYGHFLCAALDTIMRWHSDRNLYEAECAQYPGFVTTYRAKQDNSNQDNSGKSEHLDYENYRHVCHKWQFSMTKAMVSCLESGNFVQIRNALIVLIKILPHYPRLSRFGQALERRIDRLCTEEKDNRPDLYAIAYGSLGQLNAYKKYWVPEHEFHNKEVRDKDKEADKTAATAKVNGTTQKAADNAKTNGTTDKTRNATEKEGRLSSKDIKKDTKTDKKEARKEGKAEKKEKPEKQNAVSEPEKEITVKHVEKESRSRHSRTRKREHNGTTDEARGTTDIEVAKRRHNADEKHPSREKERHQEDGYMDDGASRHAKESHSDNRDSADASHSRRGDDRDMKRRKVEISSGAKVSSI